MPAAEPATEQQFHVLYSDYARWLREWLRRRLGCPEQAADLAHDTFLRVLTRPVQIQEPRAFLSTIARGLVINHLRRRELEQAWLDALAAWPEALAPSPEQREIWLEALYGIEAMLRRLPAKVRTAFLLAQLDGLKYREIAQRLEVSERMVKKYMAQAMLHCLAFQEVLHEG